MTKRKQLGVSNMLLLTLIIVLLMLVVVVGGGLWAVSSGRLDLKTLMSEPDSPAEELSAQPLFKGLDKFVVSLANPQTPHYLLLELALVSQDPRMPEQADELKSVIRNALLKHFTAKTREDVREELREIDNLQGILKEILTAAALNYGHQLSVDTVLITNVVIQ